MLGVSLQSSISPWDEQPGCLPTTRIKPNRTGRATSLAGHLGNVGFIGLGGSRPHLARLGLLSGNRINTCNDYGDGDRIDFLCLVNSLGSNENLPLLHGRRS